MIRVVRVAAELSAFEAEAARALVGASRVLSASHNVSQSTVYEGPPVEPGEVLSFPLGRVPLPTARLVETVDAVFVVESE